MRGLRTLLGISIFWLALSLLFDGLTTLVLPAHLLRVAGEAGKATTPGVLPVAGLWSDRLRPRWGRRGPLTLGALLILVALGLFGLTGSVVTVLLVYVLP